MPDPSVDKTAILEVTLRELHGLDDCTYHVKVPRPGSRGSRKKRKRRLKLRAAIERATDPNARDCEVKLREGSPSSASVGAASKAASSRPADPKDGNPSASIYGRGLICWCGAGAFLSLTVRRKPDPPTDKGSTGTVKPVPGFREYPLVASSPRFLCGYAPSEGQQHSPVSIADLCSVLARLVFSGDRIPEKGLVVISGSTASAKSQVARGLIHHYLTGPKLLGSPKVRKRRPHLVTVEDPIETWWYPRDQFLDHGRTTGVDYTPRQIGSDVESLAVAVHEAKRQTPSVLFVGEARLAGDWRHILDFAATNHFVITTTHAESLSVTLGKIFSAMRASTPAQRGEVASRIRAVIHQKALQPPGLRPVVVPTVWRQTAQGLADIVSDGLSALIPRNPPLSDKAAASASAADYACLSRLWFARQLAIPDTDREAYQRLALEDDISGD